jgi:hypothetical protein
MALKGEVDIGGEKIDLNRLKFPIGLRISLLALFAISCFGFWELIVGDPGTLNDSDGRMMVALCMVYWGFAYYVTSETGARFYIGIAEIVGGFLSNWYELGLMAAGHQEKYDRFIFIVAGIALMANGVKDLHKGAVRIWGQKDKTPNKAISSR